MINKQTVQDKLNQLQSNADQKKKNLKKSEEDQTPAQGTVLAGGRYDGLFSQLNGPTMPAVG